MNLGEIVKLKSQNPDVEYQSRRAYVFVKKLIKYPDINPLLTEGS